MTDGACRFLDAQASLLSGAQFKLLYGIVRASDGSPGLAEIPDIHLLRLTRLNPMTIVKALDELERKKVIQRVRHRGQATSAYSIPALAAPATETVCASS